MLGTKQDSQQLQTVAEDFDRIDFPWLNVQGSSPFALPTGGLTALFNSQRWFLFQVL